MTLSRAQRNRLPTHDAWCTGCGLYAVVMGRHRPDCVTRTLTTKQENEK